MSKRAIGDVRPSQVITTFGPGAIVDLQTMSVIVAGIDSWPTDEEFAIHEPRLERALRVKRFFPAKPTEGSFFTKRGTVPAYVFPGISCVPSAERFRSLARATSTTTPSGRRCFARRPAARAAASSVLRRCRHRSSWRVPPATSMTFHGANTFTGDQPRAVNA